MTNYRTKSDNNPGSSGRVNRQKKKSRAQQALESLSRVADEQNYEKDRQSEYSATAGGLLDEVLDNYIDFIQELNDATVALNKVIGHQQNLIGELTNDLKLARHQHEVVQNQLTELMQHLVNSGSMTSEQQSDILSFTEKAISEDDMKAVLKEQSFRDNTHTYNSVVNDTDTRTDTRTDIRTDTGTDTRMDTRTDTGGNTKNSASNHIQNEPVVKRIKLTENADKEGKSLYTLQMGDDGVGIVLADTKDDYYSEWVGDLYDEGER